MATQETKAEGVAGRYAAALYDLAKDKGQVDNVLGDLSRLETMIGESADLRQLVRSPVFSADQQGKALSAVLAKAKITGLSASFLQLLAKNRRLFAFGDMIGAYRAIVARDRNEAVADVTSAHPLTAQQVTELTDALKASVGKSVKINAKVDPAILGGLIVKVGSRMVDSSLRTKLNTLKVAMKGTA